MKKITRRSFITVCGAAAAAMALTACGGAASSTVASSAAESASSSAAAETAAAGTLSGNVATGGSTSMKNVIAALKHIGLRLFLYFKGPLIGGTAEIKCVHVSLGHWRLMQKALIAACSLGVQRLRRAEAGGA